MTITLTKTKLALSILVLALVVPATAYATHIFDDVPDHAFYAGAVEWAFDNEITTGKSPTEFAPLDNVTRGESVTFLQRYDTNVVQPALDDKADSGHDHDDDYVVELITTDAAPNPAFVSEREFEQRTFTTTKTGRLDVKVSIDASISCSPTNSTVRFFYLLLDDEPIQGSLLTTSQTAREPMTITGMTADDVPAGEHTIAVGAECFGTNTAGGSSWNGNIMYQIKVHGS